jgi:hypothetical protein
MNALKNQIPEGLSSSVRLPSTVFLVWDESRAEHGEMPDLLAVCVSRERAEQYLADNSTIVGEDGANIEEKVVLL